MNFGIWHPEHKRKEVFREMLNGPFHGESIAFGEGTMSCEIPVSTGGVHRYALGPHDKMEHQGWFDAHGGGIGKDTFTEEAP